MKRNQRFNWETQMSETQYTHHLSVKDALQLLLYQANQFELFKQFIFEILDSRGVIPHDEMKKLFEEFKDINHSKPLHNLMVMSPELENMNIDIGLE